MKSMSIALITVLSLATIVGCKKKGADAGDCGAAVAHALDLEAKDMLGQMPADKQAKWKAKLTTELTKACTEDKWPADGIACVAAATDGKALHACDPKMGPGYNEKMMKRMSPLMEEMMKDMGVAPPAAAAPAAAAPAAAAPAADGTAPAAGSAAAPAAGSGSAAAPAAGSGSAAAPAAAAPAAK